VLLIRIRIILIDQIFSLIMKNILLLTLFIHLSVLVSAQLILKEDGKYYTHNDALYSGTYIEYYPSGNKRVEMTVVLGEKDGITLLYFDTGHKQEERWFKKNKMDGTWITWNEKGTKIGEARYISDVKHGSWCIWDDNGTQRYQMHYNKGVKTGTWSIWNEKGILINERKY